MQFVKGMIVRSKKGHDKGRFYMICGFEGDSALLTDGTKHTLHRPKPKNPIHLAPTKTVLSDEDMRSDDKIKQVLTGFTGRAALPKEVM